MSMVSILLRVLLSLSLILQGGQAAFAAAAMPPHEANAMAVMARHSSVPCPEHAMAAMKHSTARSRHPKPDCCQHGTCSCECAQFAIADVPLHPVLRSGPAPQRILLPINDGHADAVLPHLIRPPIG